VVEGAYTVGILEAGIEGVTVKIYDDAYVSFDHEIVIEVPVAAVTLELLGSCATAYWLITYIWV
jgi:hypothetical protein